MSQQSLRDQNRVTTLIAKDDTDPTKTVAVTADPLTGALNATVVTSVGTQYDSGQVTPAAPIGTINVWDDGGTIEHVSALKPLPVTVNTSLLATSANQLPDGHNVTIDNASIAVTGTVTANTGLTQPLTDTQLRATAVPISGTVTAAAGTNLNTSALALESGGNLASIKTTQDLLANIITPGNFVSGVASATTTADTSVIAAQGSGVKIYLNSFSIANSSDLDVVIEIKSATTVVWRTMAPAKGGSNHVFTTPVALTANQALNMASLTAATTIYFSASGYKGA